MQCKRWASHGLLENKCRTKRQFRELSSRGREAGRRTNERRHLTDGTHMPSRTFHHLEVRCTQLYISSRQARPLTQLPCFSTHSSHFSAVPPLPLDPIPLPADPPEQPPARPAPTCCHLASSAPHLHLVPSFSARPSPPTPRVPPPSPCVSFHYSSTAHRQAARIYSAVSSQSMNF